MMGWFGPSKDELWRQLSQEIGAEFIKGGFWRGNKVQMHVKDWTITLDTYTESNGESSHACTRMRAPYLNPEGFRFTIFRKGFFSGLGKLLGMQDIEVGDPDFDDAFIIKGNDESKVRDLFANPQIRRMIQGQPKIRLELKNNEAWFGHRLPDSADVLHFQVVGVIKDVERLKSLFDLFVTVLDQLCRIGSAYKQVPELEL